MPEHEKPPKDIVYNRKEIVGPGRTGKIRVLRTEENPGLEPLSQHVRGKINVQGETEFRPVEVDTEMSSVRPDI